MEEFVEHNVLRQWLFRGRAGQVWDFEKIILRTEPLIKLTFILLL